MIGLFLGMAFEAVMGIKERRFGKGLLSWIVPSLPVKVVTDYSKLAHCPLADVL